MENPDEMNEGRLPDAEPPVVKKIDNKDTMNVHAELEQLGECVLS
jgi:hypothetical protein